MKATTPRQLEVLRAIADLSEALRFPPTRRELAARLGIVGSRVQQHLAQLEEQGLVEVPKRTARSILLTEAGRQRLVVLATIAGAP